jgi:hypothetical protein
MMTVGEMLAWERFKAAQRRYPGGGHRFSFRDTGRGWSVRALDVAKAASPRSEAVRLEQQLLSSQLASISRSFLGLEGSQECHTSRGRASASSPSARRDDTAGDVCLF